VKPREHKPRKLNEYVYAMPDYQAEFKYAESSLLYFMNLCCYPVKWVTGAVHGQFKNNIREIGGETWFYSFYHTPHQSSSSQAEAKHTMLLLPWMWIHHRNLMGFGSDFDIRKYKNPGLNPQTYLSQIHALVCTMWHGKYLLMHLRALKTI